MPRWLAFLRGYPASEADLSSVRGRIERLESVPPPEADLAPLHAIAIELRADVADMVASYEAQQQRLDDIEKQAKDFTFALATGIERTDRAERRIQATVARARKELKARGYEDPGLEAEGHELRDINGDRGAEDGMLPMRQAVGAPVPEASSVRGVSIEQLQRGRRLL